MKRNEEMEKKLTEMQEKVFAGELDSKELTKAVADYYLYLHTKESDEE